MGADAVIFVSKRTQRCVVAVLLICAAHIIVASCTPEPVSPMAARLIDVH